MFTLLRLAVLMTVLSSRSDSLPVASENQAMTYLSQFGYLSPGTGGSHQLLSLDILANAIRQFQAFVGLRITGYLNQETLQAMNRPRCGVKDKTGLGTTSKNQLIPKRGNKWQENNLTYWISKYPRNLAKAGTDKEVQQALDVWASVTPLTFTQKTTGPAHIQIRFEEGEHGDGDPFDGPGGTLAHAFFPAHGGDAHFDNAETWTINSSLGTNLLQAAAHEFGHSLGLAHSDVTAALMAPFYRDYEPSFKLHDDDIKAIQRLYGKKDPDSRGSGFGNRTATFQEDGNIELCSDAKIDAILNSAEGGIYVFKGQHYWKLTNTSLENGYPRLINQSWVGLSGNIDAAFTYGGKTFFFKGSKYWRYTKKILDDSYPKEISEGFKGIPNNIDAAMVWGGNGKIYFFKGSQFWMYDTRQMPPVQRTYPKPIDKWRGIPNDLDAAMEDSLDYTYFFKGDSYWRFKNRPFKVDTGYPPFPRPAGLWWFGCDSDWDKVEGAVIYPHSLQRQESSVGDIVPDGGRDANRTNTGTALHHSGANAKTSTYCPSLGSTYDDLLMKKKLGGCSVQPKMV